MVEFDLCVGGMFGNEHQGGHNNYVTFKNEFRRQSLGDVTASGYEDFTDNYGDDLVLRIE